MFSRFIRWLEELALDDRGTDSMNPFDRIIEHPEYPMARIYRESAWVGILDTYHILIGCHFRVNLSGMDRHTGRAFQRMGILDLLIFPLISLLLLNFKKLPASTDALFRGTLIIIVLIGLSLEIPRHLLAVTFTLASSPIVFLVHFFAFFKARKLKHAIKQLDADIRESAHHYSNKIFSKSKKLHKAYDLDRDKLTIRAVLFTEHNNKETFLIDRTNILYESQGFFGCRIPVSETKHDLASRNLSINPSTLRSHRYLGLFSKKLSDQHLVGATIKISEANAKGINALLQTNSFDIVD